MTIIHIYPVNDLSPHDLQDYGCQCEPDANYDSETDTMFVKHHSFDGRELVEETNRILGNTK